MFGMANNKPLDLEKNTQSLIDGMGYEECYILKFAGEKNIENIHLDVKPTNDEIEEKIETIREESIYREEVKDRYNIEKGDLAITDFTIFCNGQVLESVENASIKVGEGNYNVNLEQHMIGLSIGEEHNINWEVKEQKELHQNGGEYKAKVKISKIYNVVKPSLQEMAEMKGYQDEGTYKKQLLYEVECEKIEVLTYQAANSILERIVRSSKFKMDDDIVVDNALQYYYKYKEQALVYGMDLQQYVEKVMQCEEDIYKVCYEESKFEIQRYLVLGRWAKEKNITASEKEVREYCLKNDMEYQTLNERKILQIKHYVIEEKLIEYIKGKYVSYEV